MKETVDHTPSHVPTSYWQLSQRPLQSLVFLLPMMVLYEVGTILFASDPTTGTTQFIYARSLLQDFFDWFGVTGYYLPGIITVTVLLTWHIVRRDPWDVDLRACFWMAVETLLLALPLFVFALVLFRAPNASAIVPGIGQAAMPTWQQQLVFSIGAGIYEELLFRLIAIALLHMLLVDALALPEKWGATLAVMISAGLFALYHFSESNPFTWGKCLFYTGAGVYFAAVYVLRGFGVVAGTHAVYDVLVVLLRMTR